MNAPPCAANSRMWSCSLPGSPPPNATLSGRPVPSISGTPSPAEAIWRTNVRGSIEGGVGNMLSSRRPCSFVKTRVVNPSEPVLDDDASTTQPGPISSSNVVDASGVAAPATGVVASTIAAIRNQRDDEAPSPGNSHGASVAPDPARPQPP